MIALLPREQIAADSLALDEMNTRPSSSRPRNDSIRATFSAWAFVEYIGESAPQCDLFIEILLDAAGADLFDGATAPFACAHC